MPNLRIPFRDLFVVGIFSIIVLFLPWPVPAKETIKLRATADIWLADTNENERNTPMGTRNQFKLKSIQEMAAIRFNVSTIRKHQVLRAKLFLKPAGPHRMHRVRISTINQDWEEGTASLAPGKPTGATWYRASSQPHTHWAWDGSHFADVVMTSGNSLATWTPLQEESNGWISLAISPTLIYALIAQDSDGLAIVDGGNLAYHNNYFYSHEAGHRGPYLEIELGQPINASPAAPLVQVEPAPERAHLNSGALKVTIQHDPLVFCWKLRWNDIPIERWRVKHPEAAGPTVFYLEDMPPSETGILQTTAIGYGGTISPTTTHSATISPALPSPPELPRVPVAISQPSVSPSVSKFQVWALPGLVKISPEQASPLYQEIRERDHYRRSNAVFDGTRIHLFGGRGEYVSYQLCVENLSKAPLHHLAVQPHPFRGPERSIIPLSNIELYKNWYTKNTHQKWQPAYQVPIHINEPFTIPDPQRGLPTQMNQTLYVDIYIPKTTGPGSYESTITVSVDRTQSITLPISLEVYDYALPDRLSFWTELNSYSVPDKHAHDYFRLAHQHRAVFMPWVIRPKVIGKGQTLRLDFTEYDRLAGPLLSGEAFASNRRQGIPIRTLYLPFEDSWPTPLTRDTYHYQGYWPHRGDSQDSLTQHYLTAPYIEDALSTTYKDGIHAAQRQFIHHFQEKGWTQTELHAFYGGKNTHRLDYGSNMWWTTDEPYHWDDWLALQFFLRHWQTGLQQLQGANLSQWLGRADISRPQWQGQVLTHLVGPVYYGTGAFRQYRRCRTLALETGVDLRSYGSFNPAHASNTITLAHLLDVWLHDGRAHLPWQTLGNDSSLDMQDNVGGNAILVPGSRFGLAVVGDMRLKAARDGQQLIEYLEMFRSRYHLTREQVRFLVFERLGYPMSTRTEGSSDEDALTTHALQAEDLAELRLAFAQMIVQ